MSEVLRRLAAIVIADACGYTRLMEVDEERTRDQINLHRSTFKKLASKHNGRVLDISGDSILSEYMSVQSAIEFAADFQERMVAENRLFIDVDRMLFRIGINVGDVLDDGQDLYGDAINTAERLQTLATPGGVCISGAAHDLIDGRVSFSFHFLREQKVKNKSKPIRVYQMMESECAVWPSGQSEALSQESVRPGVAVLPFKCLGGDDDQQYLGDGIAEDIITELSKFQNIHVLARSTAFAYRQENEYLSRLFANLNVQYALEGSVRSVGRKIRISAQLVDCQTSKQIWGDRYTRNADAILDVQDEVVRLLVGMLENLLAINSDAAAPSSHSNIHHAYDYWLRGKRLSGKSNIHGNLVAISYFEKALKYDSSFSRVYTSLALTYNNNEFVGPGYEKWSEETSIARNYAQKALSLDPTDTLAHINLGWSYLQEREFDKARRHYDIAGDIAPNDADTLVLRGSAYAFCGNVDESMRLISRALTLNPVNPVFYTETKAVLCFVTRRFDECVAIFQQTPPSSIYCLAVWASALNHLGDSSPVNSTISSFVKQMRMHWRGKVELNAEQCIRWLNRRLPFKRAEDQNLLVDGLSHLSTNLLHSEGHNQATDN